MKIRNCIASSRLRNNTLWAGDEVVLDKYGWTAKTKEMRGQIEEGRRLAMEKKISRNSRKKSYKRGTDKEQTYRISRTSSTISRADNEG